MLYVIKFLIKKKKILIKESIKEVVKGKAKKIPLHLQVHDYVELMFSLKKNLNHCKALQLQDMVFMVEQRNLYFW